MDDFASHKGQQYYTPQNLTEQVQRVQEMKIDNIIKRGKLDKLQVVPAVVQRYSIEEATGSKS